MKRKLENDVPANRAAPIRLPPPQPHGNPQLAPHSLGMDQLKNINSGFGVNEYGTFERLIADKPSLSAKTYQDRFAMKERIVAFVAANKKVDLIDIVEEKFRRAPNLFRMPQVEVQYRTLDTLSRGLEINDGEAAKTWKEGNNPGQANYSNRTSVMKKVSQIQIFTEGPLSKDDVIERLPTAFQGSSSMQDLSAFASNMLIQNTATKDRIFKNGTFPIVLYFMTVDNEWLALNQDGSLKWNFDTEEGRTAFFNMRHRQYPWIMQRWVARNLFGLFDILWVFHSKKLSDQLQAKRKLLIKLLLFRFIYSCDIAWTKMVDHDLTGDSAFLDADNHNDIIHMWKYINIRENMREVNSQLPIGQWPVHPMVRLSQACLWKDLHNGKE